MRAAIEATNAQFAAAMKRADAAAIAAMFTDDGEVIPPTARGFVTGRAALESYYAARFKTARFLEVVITTVAIDVSGDLAWETGTNRVEVQVGDAARPRGPDATSLRGSAGPMDDGGTGSTP